jgi:hypothetical protein
MFFFLGGYVILYMGCNPHLFEKLNFFQLFFIIYRQICILDWSYWWKRTNYLIWSDKVTYLLSKLTTSLHSKLHICKSVDAGFDNYEEQIYNVS